MLKELGIGRCAYDWRNEHVVEFEEEILQYKKHGIEYFAFWEIRSAGYQRDFMSGFHPLTAVLESTACGRICLGWGGALVVGSNLSGSAGYLV